MPSEEWDWDVWGYKEEEEKTGGGDSGCGKTKVLFVGEGK